MRVRDGRRKERERIDAKKKHVSGRKRWDSSGSKISRKDMVRRQHETKQACEFERTRTAEKPKKTRLGHERKCLYRNCVAMDTPFSWLQACSV